MPYQITNHIVTDPVQDLAAFRRVAFWLSRAKLPRASLLWTVVVDDPQKTTEFQAVLDLFKTCYRSRVTASIQPPLPGCSCEILLPADAIVAPDTLPEIAESVRLNPTCVTVAIGRMLNPKTLLRLDSYGSNLDFATAYDTSTPGSGLPDACVMAWNPQTGRDGDPGIESAARAYLQRGPGY